MACDFHIIGVFMFVSLLCPWGTGWCLLENGTRLIPGDRVTWRGYSGIKYVMARSTPKVCGMDFLLKVEYTKEISQFRSVACCRCLCMLCSYVFMHLVSCIMISPRCFII